MDRLLKQTEVLTTLGMSRQTLYKWRLAGSFPEPVNVGARALRWRASDVQAWIASR